MHSRFQQKRRRAIGLLLPEGDNEPKGGFARHIIDQYEKQKARRKRFGSDHGEKEVRSHEPMQYFFLCNVLTPCHSGG